MEFLYLLEKIRNTFLDFFFLMITHIGEETVFLAIAILFFWCIDKRKGYFMLLVGLVGTVINQALKLVFKVPRPWIKDPNFTFVGDADIEATGYSFPSGHTQNVAGTFGSIAITSNKKWVRITSILIIALVAFSRMYLGVHTPLDVFVSLLIAAVLVFALYPLFRTEERMDRFMPYIAIGSVLISVAFLIFVFALPEEAYDIGNLNSGRENASTLFGCIIILPIVYYVDKHFTKFETSASWYGQILKFVLGLVGVLLIQKGLDAPLAALFGNEYIARGVRYALIVSFAGLLWPMTFKYFKKLKISALDRWGEKVKSLFFKNDESANVE